MIFAWAVREVESNEASLLTLLEPVAVPIWTFIAWRSYPSYQLPSVVDFGRGSPDRGGIYLALRHGPSIQA